MSEPEFKTAAEISAEADSCMDVERDPWEIVGVLLRYGVLPIAQRLDGIAAKLDQILDALEIIRGKP